MRLVELLFESDYRHGDDFGKYLELESGNTDKAKSILSKLGVKQEKMFEMLNVLFKEQRKSPQFVNQLFAVVDGAKPMVFDTKFKWSSLGRIGTLLLNQSENIGLTWFMLDGMIAYGKPENVNMATPEIVRWATTRLKDEQFHRVIGLALGYPPQDVETFVQHLFL